MKRSGRLTAALVAGFPLLSVAPAAAVVPPAVDATLLPRPAPPAPVIPTEQRRPCYQSAVGLTGTADNPLSLDAVWPLTRGEGQKIAVIDTGVARHRLLPRLIGGGDYVSRGDGTADCDGHGTIVAGIAAAAPSAGFSGVAPMPPSCQSGSRATSSPQMVRPPVSETSTPSPWRSAPRPISARPSSTSRLLPAYPPPKHPMTAPSALR